MKLLISFFVFNFFANFYCGSNVIAAEEIPGNKKINMESLLRELCESSDGGTNLTSLATAYKILALKYHPDKDSTSGSKERFQDLKTAYLKIQEQLIASARQDTGVRTEKYFDQSNQQDVKAAYFQEGNGDFPIYDPEVVVNLKLSQKNLLQGFKKIRLTRKVFNKNTTYEEEVWVYTLRIKRDSFNGTYYIDPLEGVGDVIPGHRPANISFRLSIDDHPKYKPIDADKLAYTHKLTTEEKDKFLSKEGFVLTLEDLDGTEFQLTCKSSDMKLAQSFGGPMSKSWYKWIQGKGRRAFRPHAESRYVYEGDERGMLLLSLEEE